MDIEALLKTVWDLLNTPIGISVVAGGFLSVLSKIYTAKPEWAAHEGSIITAIKHAEKIVPDHTKNKGLAKLDVALRYVLGVYEIAASKKASKKLVNSLKEGIQIKHDELVLKGTLKPGPGDPLKPKKDKKK
jgi:hypothetical protein